MPATDDGSKAAALAYACRALPIFPTRDKRPLTRHGHLDATCVGPRVAEWWRRWPDASISLRTGRASGIAVLDLDRKGGRDGFLAVPNWRELTRVIALTPSGGRHLFFADEVGRVRCSQDAVGSGVDVRGEGGAVILPPGDGRAWMGPDLLSMLHQLPPWPASVPLFKNSQGPTDKGPAAKGPTDTSFEQRNGRGLDLVAASCAVAALMVIPADDDAVWWRVAAVLRMEFGDAGFRWFDRWSRTSDKYDPAAVVRQWNAVANVRSIRMGTLVRLAQLADPEWRRNVTPAYERLRGEKMELQL